MSGIDLPVCVRIKTSRVDRDVTAQVTDITYTSSIPGGFSNLTMTLHRQLDLPPQDAEYYSAVYVYDGRNGRTLWEGRLDDPARGADDTDGEVFTLTATGGQAHARDQVFPIVYVDQNLDPWVRSRYSSHGANTETTEVPDALSGLTDADEPWQALSVYANEGSTVSLAWQGDFIYRAIDFCNQLVARVRADIVAEGASSNYQQGIYGRPGYAGADTIDHVNWATSPSVLAINFGTGLATDTQQVSFRGNRFNSSTTADNLARCYFANVSIRAAIKKVDGTDNLSTVGYNVNNIDPNEVVTDLLGRILNRFDGVNATIIGSGVDIDQIAYRDGTTAADVFTDLAAYDPDYYWAAWETVPSTGKLRFEYIPWPTTIRYEAGIEDGYESESSGADLYNAVDVRWRDARNNVRHTKRTQNVPVLTAAGLTRTSYIDLADEIGSLANAQYTGDNFLIQHQYPPNAGTLTIARPILDNDTGRMVQPWELLPGCLIRVRGLSPRVDALNTTTRDGVTIFRVISVQFDSASATASLELDSYARTLQTALSTLTSSINKGSPTNVAQNPRKK